MMSEEYIEKLKEVQRTLDSAKGDLDSGDVNAAASYDEGVRDALPWLTEGTPRPEIGREIWQYHNMLQVYNQYGTDE